MLSYLHVKNLALIDDVEVEFGPGLNILTGETGAGKSVLIGSISLALGKKMSREMIRNENLPALVELVFSVENEKCRELGISDPKTDIVEKDHVYVISLENVNLRYMDRYYTSIYGDDYLGRELVDTLDYGERVFEVYDFEVRK